MKKRSKGVVITNIVLIVLACVFLVENAFPITNSSVSVRMNTDIDFNRISTKFHERIDWFQNRVDPVLPRAEQLVSNLNEAVEWLNNQVANLKKEN